MVRIEDFWPEGEIGIGNHLRRHGVGKVHGQEGNGDVFQLFYLGDVLCVPGNVDPGVAKGEDVTVVLPFAGRAGRCPLCG